MQAPDRGFGGGFGGGRKCFPYVVMSSPAGEESQWWGEGSSWNLDLHGGEGERCLAGSSLWRWHRGDCAWARGCGVWRQGGAWVWQWAGTGQEVALNSCHNGRALGCGGSEPRPERQGRWHGGGRRQVRM